MVGTDLTEWHSGYRAYSVAALRDIPFERNADGFDFDTQVIVQLFEAGRRVGEVPIPTYYGDEVCHVNGLAYARDVTRDVLALPRPQDGLRLGRDRVRLAGVRAQAGATTAPTRGWPPGWRGRPPRPDPRPGLFRRRAGRAAWPGRPRGHRRGRRGPRAHASPPARVRGRRPGAAASRTRSATATTWCCAPTPRARLGVRRGCCRRHATGWRPAASSWSACPTSPTGTRARGSRWGASTTTAAASWTPPTCASSPGAASSAWPAGGPGGQPPRGHRAAAGGAGPQRVRGQGRRRGRLGRWPARCGRSTAPGQALRRACSATSCCTS